MVANIFRNIVLSLVLMVIVGLGYHLVVTGIAQVAAKDQAQGSLIYDKKGTVIGSELIGQKFDDPKYFQGRVSSIVYDGAGSGSNNYAPSNPDMIKRTKESVANWKKENPDVPLNKVPVDLVTNSGSGLDPHISPEAAYVQIPRIEKLTGISENKLKALVHKNTQGKELGLFGQSRVNVLKLNLDLQELM